VLQKQVGILLNRLKPKSKFYYSVKKIKNTQGKSCNQYRYLLTEEGIKEKIALTEKFIERKKREYDELVRELEIYNVEMIKNGK